MPRAQRNGNTWIVGPPDSRKSPPGGEEGVMGSLRQVNQEVMR